jgi:CPA2 family monovalent cation:H+ antiporter-2
MEHSAPFILNITIALTIAVIGGLVASSLKQSPILGYLLAGVVIGPFTPGFVGDSQQIATLADVGVIFLMFALGVAFSIKDLARIRNAAVFGVLIQLVLTIAAGWAVSRFSGLPNLESLLIGGALTASSSMVILKTLLDRGEVASGHGRLLMAMSIVQDLLIVILIVLLPKLTIFNTEAGAQALIKDVGITLLKAGLFVGIFLAVGLRLVPKLMAHVARLRSSELFIVTAAVFALGAASVSTLLGLSAALGAFVAGLVLSESEFDHRVISEVVPIRDLFATLFFVSVGMLIDLTFVIEYWPWVLGAALVTIAIKSLATLIGLLPFRLTPRTVAFTTLGMIPIGELNFVFAQAGQNAGILSQDSYKLILATALVTIIVTPFAFRLAPSLAALMNSIPKLRDCFDPVSKATGVGAALEQHAIIVGYGRVGHSVADGLLRNGLNVAVIDMRLTRVREGLENGLPSVYGSATSASVLEAAHIKRARLAVIALTEHGPTITAIRQIRELNPQIVIAARAVHASHEKELRLAGANLVIVPELEGATALLNGALDLIGGRIV